MRADIHDGQEHKRSMQGPDTDAQDQPPPFFYIRLATHGRSIQNEIGCARISMMARSTNAPCKGRIQMRKTNPLHFFTFGLQRTAGPYSWVKSGKAQCEHMFSALPLRADIAQQSRHVRSVLLADIVAKVFFG